MSDELGFFFENHPDPMLVYDPASLRILTVNQAALDVYGYAKDDFLSMTISGLRPPEDVPRLLDAVREHDNKPAGAYIWRHLTQNGDILFVDVISRPITWQGQPARLVVARNVTATTHLQNFFEALPGKFLVLDARDFTIVAVSDEYLRATARKRSELKGRLLFQAFPDNPNDPQADGVGALSRSLCRVRETRLSDTMAVQRYPIPRPEAEGGGFEERFWSVINSPIKGADGNVVYIIHRVEDVTDFVHMAGGNDTEPERALQSRNAQMAAEILLRSREVRESNQRLHEQGANLRMAQRLMSLGIWKANQNTGHLYWSDNIYDMFGVIPTEFGHTIDAYMQLVHPEDRGTLLQPLPRGETSQKIFEFRHRVVRPDGRIVHVRGVAEIEYIDGDPVFSGVVQDISAEVETQARLESAATMQRIADAAAKLGGWRVNLDENIVRWSEETARIHERPEQLRPSVAEAMTFYAPEHQERIRQAFNACVTEGKPFDEALQIIKARSGERAWVRAIGEPIWRDGKIIGAQGAFQDITEQRELIERLNQSQKMESLGQLTGGIAHDFNNLLTVILGNSELLKEANDLPPHLRIFADMIANAASRGSELTNRLLAFARRQALEPRLVDVNKLVASMENLLRRTFAEDIDIELVRGGGVWNTEVDPSQLESALLNLAINARDAMPHGGKLTIETANARLDDQYAADHHEVAPGQYVVISVSDTGSGMPPNVAARAFDPFFTTKPAGKGSGLGLSMVYGFVKQSGGHAKIYSEAGEGTTIRLYFPRAVSAAKAEALPTPPQETPMGSEHILVVEDDELVRAHVINLVQSLGYRVTSAASGQQALDILASRQDIDLLFTDIIMPGGVNGRQLADQARVIYPGLKVLYTSGYTENAIVHHGRLDPGVHLLGKPYRRNELANKLRKVLEEPLQ
jgi:PAS domain S-box-containing protein